MPFDIVSFLAGLGGGVVGTAATGRLLARRAQRRQIAERMSDDTESAEDTPRRRGSSLGLPGRAIFARQNSVARYREDLTTYLQQYHVLGNLVSLTDVLVEPHVLIDISERDYDLSERSARVQSTSRVVPRSHDMPEIYSAYNMESMRLAEFLNGEQHIAILGNPGMGKSTSMVALAMMALDLVSFPRVDEFLPENLAELEGKEIVALEEDYERMQKLALEQLRAMHLEELRKKYGKEMSEEEIEELHFQSVDPRVYLPIMVHVGSIHVDMGLFGIQVDPSEPLLRAVQEYVQPLTARMSLVMLYQQLEQGNCLVLLDGYDDLSESERHRIYPWLKSFMEHYGHNRIVISGPATGYDALLTLDFTPAFIAPITEEGTNNLIKHWLHAWFTREGKELTGNREEQKLINQMLKNNRNRSVLEITFKIWHSLLEGNPADGRRAWYEQYVTAHAPEMEQTASVLREIAKVLLDRGAPLKMGQLSELASSRAEADGNSLSNADAFIRNLRESGLLVNRGDGNYDYRHPLLTAYLAGENLIHDMEHRLPEVANNESWFWALSFASAGVDMTPAVREKLSGETDLLLNNLFSVVYWLPESSLKTQWRGEILKRLTAAFMADSQYPAIRERAVAGLVASRDPNVLFALRQGVRHANPTIRKLACIGLGAFGSTEVIRELRSMIVDEDPEVQLAAAQALGAIRSDAALETLVQGLLEGDENMRQAIAEAFAAIPGEGHAILKDAVEHDDMLVRRASVYGLARIPSMWAMRALYDIMMEDDQWYVRSAAEAVFTYANDPSRQGPKAPPALHELTWLNQWVDHHNIEVDEETVIEELLIRALLQDKQPIIRELAARTLTQSDYSFGMKPLYVALMDQNEKVRTSAYQALAELNQQASTLLPGIA